MCNINIVVINTFIDTASASVALVRDTVIVRRQVFYDGSQPIVYWFTVFSFAILHFYTEMSMLHTYRRLYAICLASHFYCSWKFFGSILNWLKLKEELANRYLSMITVGVGNVTRFPSGPRPECYRLWTSGLGLISLGKNLDLWHQ